MHIPSLARRNLVGALAGIAALSVTRGLGAQGKPPAAPGAAPPKPPGQQPKSKLEVPPAAPPSPALQAIIDSTAQCEREGRYCLARCTDHLAAGFAKMDQCQRTIMNMLPVTGAMADVAGYRNAAPQNIKALASACAVFCRACAQACEPHASHHVECKACMDACVACAKACEAFTA
jgi:Cys-rich four helix bundle protein (predicted Tat secretion target)